MEHAGGGKALNSQLLPAANTDKLALQLNVQQTV